MWESEVESICFCMILGTERGRDFEEKSQFRSNKVEVPIDFEIDAPWWWKILNRIGVAVIYVQSYNDNQSLDKRRNLITINE